MKHSIKIGFSFGLTSGIITTLGLIVGLHSGTHSKLAIVGGVFTIAIADAFSDALGIHISEESESKHSSKEIWLSTISTFLSKFIFSSTFIIPIILFEMPIAILISIIWGFLLLGIFSFSLGKGGKIPSWYVVFEHWLIALIVIGLTHIVGKWLSIVFN